MRSDRSLGIQVHHAVDDTPSSLGCQVLVPGQQVTLNGQPLTAMCLLSELLLCGREIAKGDGKRAEPTGSRAVARMARKLAWALLTLT
jgi:hypothetical protein